jgi:hypothetical protein
MQRIFATGQPNRNSIMELLTDETTANNFHNLLSIFIRSKIKANHFRLWTLSPYVVAILQGTM